MGRKSMTGWLILGGIALYLSKRGGGGMGGDQQYPGLTTAQLEDVARQEAASAGIPAWLPLATMEVESGIRHLKPRGSGMGRTFYPMGVQRNRGMDLTGLEGTDLDAALEDPMGNISAAIQGDSGLAALWQRYGPDVERVRLGWVLPAAARRGRPWPERTGSQLTAHRLARWNRAVAKWGGPQTVA